MDSGGSAARSGDTLGRAAGLLELIAERVELGTTRVASAGVNPAGKVTSIIAGMAAGADSIADLDVVRSGDMPQLIGGCMRRPRWVSFSDPSPMVTSVSSPRSRGRILVNLARRTELLTGIDQQAYIDIDSLLRPVFGHHKQGASFGHAKIAGRVLLRKGLSPLAVTISTPTAAPVVAEIRFRAGKANSGRGRLDGQRGHPDRPRRRRPREDPGPRRLRVWFGPVARACLKAGAQYYSLTKIYLVSPDGMFRWRTEDNHFTDTTLVNRATTELFYGIQNAPSTLTGIESPYDEVATTWDVEHPTDFDFAEVVKEKLAAVRGKYPPHVLDLGCGTGRVLDLRLPPPDRYAGVDSSTAMLNLLVRKHPKVAAVYPTDARAALAAGTFTPGPFDWVFLDASVDLTETERSSVDQIARLAVVEVDGTCAARCRC